MVGMLGVNSRSRERSWKSVQFWYTLLHKISRCGFRLKAVIRRVHKKKRAAGLLQGPLIMKVKNLQRGTADAVELGGKSHHVHQLSAIWWFFVQRTMLFYAMQACADRRP
jgi:hypothetical protein